MEKIMMDTPTFNELECLRKSLFIAIHDKRLIDTLTDRLYATTFYCGCTVSCQCRATLRKSIHNTYRKIRH